MPHISIIYSGWVASSAVALAIFQFIQFFFPILWLFRDWRCDEVLKRFLTKVAWFYLIICIPGSLIVLGMSVDGLRNTTYQSFFIDKWWLTLMKLLGTLSTSIGVFGVLLQVLMLLLRLTYRKDTIKIENNFKWAWRLYIWTCYLPCFIWIIVFSVDKIIKSLN